MVLIILQVEVWPDLVRDDDRTATAAAATYATGRRCAAFDPNAFIPNIVGIYGPGYLRQNDHQADQKGNSCEYIPWFHLAPHHLVLSCGFVILQQITAASYAKTGRHWVLSGRKHLQ
jgi:hypothetical protein